MIDVLLYALIGVVIVAGVASQRLVGGKAPTGPQGALVIVGLCRFLILAGWISFAIMSGYWQIAVLMATSVVISYAGILAKKAAA